jgi:hypothetical protein
MCPQQLHQPSRILNDSARASMMTTEHNAKAPSRLSKEACAVRAGAVTAMSCYHNNASLQFDLGRAAPSTFVGTTAGFFE